MGGGSATILQPNGCNHLIQDDATLLSDSPKSLVLVDQTAHADISWHGHHHVHTAWYIDLRARQEELASEDLR